MNSRRPGDRPTPTTGSGTGRRRIWIGRVIKYIGSKRRLVPVLARICQAAGARTALDLFTGTTRVAQAFKAQGVHVTAVDSARYAEAFARTYIETDAAATDAGELRAAITRLNAVPGKAGLRARDVQPAGQVLPSRERRSDRCRPGLHRVGVCGVTSLSPPVDVAHRGGGPGRLDDRCADGLREAVGAPVVQSVGAAGARAPGRAGARHPWAMR